MKKRMKLKPIEAWMVRCSGFDRGEEPLCHSRRKAMAKIECEDCEVIRLVPEIREVRPARRKARRRA